MLSPYRGRLKHGLFAGLLTLAGAGFTPAAAQTTPSSPTTTVRTQGAAPLPRERAKTARETTMRAIEREEANLVRLQQAENPKVRRPN